MRYIRKKTTVSTVVDTIVHTLDEVIALLKSIQSKELSCSLRFKEGPIYENARILEIGVADFRWRAQRDRQALIQRSPIKDIDMLEVNTSTNLVAIKPDNSRWNMLDDTEINFEEEKTIEQLAK